jgi:hypothetical protein
MPPASLGDTDRIRCAFKFRIYVTRILFLVRCMITNGAETIGASLLLKHAKIDAPIRCASPNYLEIA